MTHLTFLKTDGDRGRLWATRFGVNHVGNLYDKMPVILTGQTDDRGMFYEALTPVGVGWIFHVWLDLSVIEEFNA